MSKKSKKVLKKGPKKSNLEHRDSLQGLKKQASQSNTNNNRLGQNQDSCVSDDKKASTKYSSGIHRNSYMQTFITQGWTEYFAKCMYCKKEMIVDNIYSHIKSKKHKKRTPSNEIAKLDGLIQAIEEYSSTKKSKKAEQKVKSQDQERKRIEDDKKSYLEFLAFAMSEKLSFSQISKIGVFVKNMMKKKSVNFFISQSFDEEEISDVSKECFHSSLLKDIKNQIRTKPYSLIIDNSTICGENYCILQVRYLNEIDGNNVVSNRIFSVNKLGESSDSKTLHNIVKEKLITDEQIKNNMVGICHDNAATLIGANKGLVTRMQKENSILFSLNDPCHSFNLVLKNALKQLPTEIPDFITSIHKHFKSPQRKALLKKIQRENGMKELYLKNYCKTRWLSLGESLTRLIKIWDSLVIYMNRPEKKKKEYEDCENDDVEMKKFDYDKFSQFLNDHLFYSQIIFTSYIVDILNQYNVIFQNQSLGITRLKKNIVQSYFLILGIMIRSEKMNFDIDSFINLDWEKDAIQSAWFYDAERFIDHLCNDLNPERFEKIRELSNENLIKFYTSSAKFIGTILKDFPAYLPLTNETLNLVTFLELKEDYGKIKEKMLAFGEKFKLINKKNQGQFNEEIIKLLSHGMLTSFKQITEGDTIKLWDIIKVEGLELLNSLAKIGHSLPTTSATIEQAFSIMKLIKTEKRNQLSDESLEALILIDQEFKQNGLLQINDEMILNFQMLKKRLSERKSGKKWIIHRFKK